MPWVALTVLLAAGCATMPDSGEPQAVSPPPSSDQGVQVRVIPVPPRDGQSPREVLQNFLDASISDEHDYQTARQYLTPEAVKTWQPDSGAVVLYDTTPHQSSGDGDLDHATVTLRSQEVATLDAKHTYQPKSDQFAADFTLINVAKDADKDGKDAPAKAQWRITDLPSTLILNQTNFHNAYQQVDRYFFSLPDPRATAVTRRSWCRTRSSSGAGSTRPPPRPPRSPRGPPTGCARPSGRPSTAASRPPPSTPATRPSPSCRSTASTS